MAGELSVPLTQPIPLLCYEGTWRIAGTRISLDSVIHHYRAGTTPQQIVEKFQGLVLADLYAVLVFYLNHQGEVEQYLQAQESKGDALQVKSESTEG